MAVKEKKEKLQIKWWKCSIHSVDKYNIERILEDIEKEEPTSDDQVQQFEEYGEQILITTAGIFSEISFN